MRDVQFGCPPNNARNNELFECQTSQTPEIVSGKYKKKLHPKANANFFILRTFRLTCSHHQNSCLAMAFFKAFHWRDQLRKRTSIYTRKRKLFHVCTFQGGLVVLPQLPQKFCIFELPRLDFMIMHFQPDFCSFPGRERGGGGKILQWWPAYRGFGPIP